MNFSKLDWRDSANTTQAPTITMDDKTQRTGVDRKVHGHKEEAPVAEHRGVVGEEQHRHVMVPIF